MFKALAVLVLSLLMLNASAAVPIDRPCGDLTKRTVAVAAIHADRLPAVGMPEAVGEPSLLDCSEAGAPRCLAPTGGGNALVSRSRPAEESPNRVWYALLSFDDGPGAAAYSAVTPLLAWGRIVSATMAQVLTARAIPIMRPTGALPSGRLEYRRSRQVERYCLASALLPVSLSLLLAGLAAIRSRRR
ncbi:hypothetical protein SAMN07250955_10664 [Arboricoccus pini]|uniref:Uncharacterized protein n=1 Tax=Arboricoccus pini TaxID=1963835 RepID=A0A212R6X2_9PROT|nr:hypothetical protein [Arboricoccus pini]SNB67828.1 hypothetical protein SAMN07250955_10664 [Arboricoccus pini]